MKLTLTNRRDENNHLPVSGKEPWLHQEPTPPFWHILLTKVFSENKNKVLQEASLQVSASFINYQSVARGSKKRNEMCENIHNQVLGLLFSPWLLPVKHQSAVTGEAVQSDPPRNSSLPSSSWQQTGDFPLMGTNYRGCWVSVTQRAAHSTLREQKVIFTLHDNEPFVLCDPWQSTSAGGSAVLVFIKAPGSMDLTKQTGGDSALAPSSFFALLSFMGKRWNKKKKVALRLRKTNRKKKKFRKEALE